MNLSQVAELPIPSIQIRKSEVLQCSYYLQERENSGSLIQNTWLNRFQTWLKFIKSSPYSYKYYKHDFDFCFRSIYYTTCEQVFLRNQTGQSWMKKNPPKSDYKSLMKGVNCKYFFVSSIMASYFVQWDLNKAESRKINLI